jgi:hypothetical protein
LQRVRARDQPESGMAYSPAQIEALEAGLAALIAGDPYLAHERFEAAWRTATPPSRTLLHGLSQLAASYYQLSLGRGRAAVRTWHKARAKLAAAEALTPVFAARVDALHARLGLSADGPRFFDPAQLRALADWPVPDLAILRGRHDA